MKKILLTALVLVARASLFTASAASKKKNVKKVTPVVLASEGDSLSYAAGVYATRGLVPFIQQSYQVDTAYMADFIRGYEEAIQLKLTAEERVLRIPMRGYEVIG